MAKKRKKAAPRSKRAGGSKKKSKKKTKKRASKTKRPSRKKKAKKKTASKGKSSKSKGTKTKTKKKAAKSKPTPKPPKEFKPKKREWKKEELAGIRAKLEEEREELTIELKEIEEAAFQSSQSELSGEVGYDEDYADAGSATFEREKDLSIHNNVLDLLEKVNKALRKIDDGWYGTCESCGKPITKVRLKALPSVLLCLECKRREERR